MSNRKMNVFDTTTSARSHGRNPACLTSFTARKLPFNEGPMTNDLQSIGNTLSALADSVQKSCWLKGDFLISLVLGVMGVTVSGIGVYFSVKAFKEARAAKHAATEAGKTVKIQTITIDLTEILQKLDKLQIDISFEQARDLLTEITRRLQRITSPFETDQTLSDKIAVLQTALSKAKDSLKSVRPSDPSKEEVPRAVYYGVESDFAAIATAVAGLLGLFEKQTINFGVDHAERS